VHECNRWRVAGFEDRAVHALAVETLAAELRQQRGVDVEHASEPVLGHDQEAQESGQHHELGAGPSISANTLR
jgi:HD superfamily phosphohydrolase YqeK